METIALYSASIVPASDPIFATVSFSPDDGLWHINCLGQWSYAAALALYAALLAGLALRFRVIWEFTTWRHFFRVAVLLFLVLGLLFEWIADVLYVWTFPQGRDLKMIEVPILGWITGHQVPICEIGWIAVVVPLFYYLYLWATLVFYDIIYVVDPNNRKQTYKVEQRWVGFHGTTRILWRWKGQKGREHETELLRREPGFVARSLKAVRGSFHAGKA